MISGTVSEQIYQPGNKQHSVLKIFIFYSYEIEKCHITQHFLMYIMNTVTQNIYHSHKCHTEQLIPSCYAVKGRSVSFDIVQDNMTTIKV